MAVVVTGCFLLLFSVALGLRAPTAKVVLAKQQVADLAGQVVDAKQQVDDLTVQECDARFSMQAIEKGSDDVVFVDTSLAKIAGDLEETFSLGKVYLEILALMPIGAIAYALLSWSSLSPVVGRKSKAAHKPVPGASPKVAAKATPLREAAQGRLSVASSEATSDDGSEEEPALLSLPGPAAVIAAAAATIVKAASSSSAKQQPTRPAGVGAAAAVAAPPAQLAAPPPVPATAAASGKKEALADHAVPRAEVIEDKQPPLPPPTSVPPPFEEPAPPPTPSLPKSSQRQRNLPPAPLATPPLPPASPRGSSDRQHPLPPTTSASLPMEEAAPPPTPLLPKTPQKQRLLPPAPLATPPLPPASAPKFPELQQQGAATWSLPPNYHPLPEEDGELLPPLPFGAPGLSELALGSSHHTSATSFVNGAMPLPVASVTGGGAYAPGNWSIEKELLNEFQPPPPGLPLLPNSLAHSHPSLGEASPWALQQSLGLADSIAALFHCVSSERSQAAGAAEQSAAQLPAMPDFLSSSCLDMAPPPGLTPPSPPSPPPGLSSSCSSPVAGGFFQGPPGISQQLLDVDAEVDDWDASTTSEGDSAESPEGETKPTEAQDETADIDEAAVEEVVQPTAAEVEICSSPDLTLINLEQLPEEEATQTQQEEALQRLEQERPQPLKNKKRRPKALRSPEAEGAVADVVAAAAVDDALCTSPSQGAEAAAGLPAEFPQLAQPSTQNIVRQTAVEVELEETRWRDRLIDLFVPPLLGFLERLGGSRGHWEFLLPTSSTAARGLQQRRASDRKAPTSGKRGHALQQQTSLVLHQHGRKKPCSPRYPSSRTAFPSLNGWTLPCGWPMTLVLGAMFGATILGKMHTPKLPPGMMTYHPPMGAMSGAPPMQSAQHMPTQWPWGDEPPSFGYFLADPTRTMVIVPPGITPPEGWVPVHRAPQVPESQAPPPYCDSDPRQGPVRFAKVIDGARSSPTTSAKSSSSKAAGAQLKGGRPLAAKKNKKTQRASLDKKMPKWKAGDVRAPHAGFGSF